jgi:hypothetical protein
MQYSLSDIEAPENIDDQKAIIAAMGVKLAVR